MITAYRKILQISSIGFITIILLASCAAESAPTPSPTRLPTLTRTPFPSLTPTETPTEIPPTLTPTPVPPLPAYSVFFPLGPGRDADQSPGTVTMIGAGNRTQVSVEIRQGPVGVSQTLDVRQGTCALVGENKISLNSVVAGKSTTIINESLANLLNGSLTIHAHKSEVESGVYVACGAIPRGAVVFLGAGRDDDQSPGVAVLTQITVNKAFVNLFMNPVASGIARPAQIHAGTCPNVVDVRIPLNNLVDGKSATIVDGVVTEMQKGAFSINVRKSFNEANIYVACGIIK